jgi:mRNA interferase HigB
MHVYRTDIVHKCRKKHAEVRDQLEAWLEDAQRAKWQNPLHVRESYANARPISDDRIVFDIKGNKYRLVVKVNYQAGIAQIRWAGTHAEYDRIDPNTI